MAIVTLHNRYREPFVGLFNGEEYVVPGGKTLATPDYVAHHLKRRSIIKDNPVTGECEYQLYIEELDSPQPVLDVLPAESLDRADMEDFREVEIVDSKLKSSRPERKSPTDAIVLSIEHA